MTSIKAGSSQGFRIIRKTKTKKRMGEIIMRSFNSVELLRFITILPLIIVLTAMAVGLQPSSEGGAIYLSADTSELTAAVETNPIN